jgi:N-acetylneuraminic acid mutarotase
MGLGKNGYNTYKDFYKYTPSLNTWTKIEDFPGTARYSAASFTKGNLAYVGTGRLQNEDADDFWSYNPQNNQWNQTINFTEKTSCAIGFSINSNSYVYNWNTSYLYNLFKKIRSYNGTSWTELANLQSVPYLGLVSSIFSINGKAYLFAEGVSLLEFDPITNQTTKLTIPNGMQWRNTVFVIGNKAYVIAVDQYGSSFKSVWEFDPSK